MADTIDEVLTCQTQYSLLHSTYRTSEVELFTVVMTIGIHAKRPTQIGPSTFVRHCVLP